MTVNLMSSNRDKSKSYINGKSLKSDLARKVCNICQEPFVAENRFQRFCAICHESSEIYRSSEGEEYELNGLHFENDELVMDDFRSIA